MALIIIFDSTAEQALGHGMPCPAFV